MVADGAIHEISQMLGRVEAKLDALDERMTSNHADAEKHWDHIEAEQRTMKHEQRNLEQKIYGLGEAQKRVSLRLRPLEEIPAKLDTVDRCVAAVEVVNERVESMEKRVGKMEKLALTVSIYGGIAAGLMTVVGGVLLRYSGTIWHWLVGKA